MGNSIFEFADKFGYDSPWKEDWVREGSASKTSEDHPLTIKSVTPYRHPDKAN